MFSLYRTSGGKLVDANAALEKELNEELEKVDRIYGATGPDFNKFPTFNFAGMQIFFPMLRLFDVGLLLHRSGT
jgi:hypothetical protein